MVTAVRDGSSAARTGIGDNAGLNDRIAALALAS
jgi:hypothetical protein